MMDWFWIILIIGWAISLYIYSNKFRNKVNEFANKAQEKAQKISENDNRKT